MAALGRTTLPGSYGEITNTYAAGEIDATIIEVAFHDNVQDAELLRDPRVRDQLAPQRLRGDAGILHELWRRRQTSALPSAPTSISAVSNASGEVTVSWAAGQSSAGGYTGVYGGPATGFRIYASTNGYGFDGGTFVAGGATTSATLSGYDPTLPYYFKVVAVNAGGESKASEVATALPSGGAKHVLIVNGFDRHVRSANFQYTSLPPALHWASVDRVWSRYNNSFDYVEQVHAAIHAAAPGVHVASASNEAVISGAVNLADYDTVIWILGEESTADDTFGAAEQTKVEQFIAGGGNLFLSGAEIGWDLDRPSGPTAADRSFYETTLLGNYVSDDASTYTATPDAGGIFAGMSNIVFSNGSAFSSLDGQVYNVDFPDVISPQAGAQVGAELQQRRRRGGDSGRGHRRPRQLGDVWLPIRDDHDRRRSGGRDGSRFRFLRSGRATGERRLQRRRHGGRGGLHGVARFERQPVTPGEQGDADFDGQVDDDDYSIWKLQFGTTPGAGGAAGAGNGAVGNGAATAVDRSASETSLQKWLVAGSLGSSSKSHEVWRPTSIGLNRAVETAFGAGDLLLVATVRTVRGRAIEQMSERREVGQCDVELRAGDAGLSALKVEEITGLHPLL